LYPKYFGLSEASFSITPDPQYLFLSEQHREALAHLLYGAGEGGGFVLLTGEVGTGKTTVCRAFLEQLPPEVDVALILNPAVSSIELLRGICDEFRIQVGEHERTSKQLVDRINDFLLQAHANGRRPVLMIDEAQNLRPKVLEQIRLLTNLETPKHKLLQIFLVGQPELRTLLGRPGLRQLDQRITARFHLKPLSARETGEYIRHRLAVGGVERPLFTPAAIRRIHALSGGVPRLINILCDRALLGAYVSRSAHVTPRIVDRSAQEVKGEAALPSPPRRMGRALVAASLVAALIGGWWIRGWLEAGGSGAVALAARALGVDGWGPGPAAGSGQGSAATREAPAEVRGTQSDARAQVLPEAKQAAPGVRPTLAAVSPFEPPPSLEGNSVPASLAGVATAAPVGEVPSPATPDAGAAQAANPLPASAEQPGGGPQGEPVEQPLPLPVPLEIAQGQDDAATPMPSLVQPAPAPPVAPPAAVPGLAETAATALVPVTPITTPAAAAARIDPRSLALDEADAMRLLLTLWGLNLKDFGGGAPCDKLPAYGLRCERDRGTWRQLYTLNMPALLRVRPQPNQGRDASYLVLTGMKGENVTLSHPEGSHQMPRADLKSVLSGSYVLVWQPPPMGTPVISAGSSGEPVRWLRKLLSRVPELGVADNESGVFDAAMGAALRRFQVKYGLNPDGIAGPKTLIQLNNAVGMPGIPKLSAGA